MSLQYYVYFIQVHFIVAIRQLSDEYVTQTTCKHAPFWKRLLIFISPDEKLLAEGLSERVSLIECRRPKSVRPIQHGHTDSPCCWACYDLHWSEPVRRWRAGRMDRWRWKWQPRYLSVSQSLQLLFTDCCQPADRALPTVVLRSYDISE